jgi:hypothetical protein
MLFTNTMFATMIVAALLSDASVTRSFSSTDFERLAGPAPSEHACWDDRSGQPHCHA